MKQAYKYLVVVAAIVFAVSCKGIYEDGNELSSAYKSEVNSVTLEELNAKTDNGEPFTLIDVRQAEDYVVQSLPGSVNIPRGMLEFQILDSAYWEAQYMFPPAKEEEIIVYSEDGTLGILAARSLQQLGFTNVSNLQDGFKSSNPNPVESAAPQPSSGCGE